MARPRKRVADFDGALAEMAKHEIRGARDVRECRASPGRRTAVRARPAPRRRSSRCKRGPRTAACAAMHRQRVHAVGRLRLVQVARYWPRCENRQPSRIAAMPKTLENVRQTNRFGHALDLGERGDAGEFVVRLVDQHDGLARAVQDALDRRAARCRCRWGCWDWRSGPRASRA